MNLHTSEDRVQGRPLQPRKGGTKAGFLVGFPSSATLSVKRFAPRAHKRQRPSLPTAFDLALCCPDVVVSDDFEQLLFVDGEGLFAPGALVGRSRLFALDHDVERLVRARDPCRPG